MERAPDPGPEPEGSGSMSRRRNGTNRVQELLNASRFTGDGKPKRISVDAEMLNRKLEGDKTDGRKNN